MKLFSLKSAVVFIGIFMRLMNLVNYIFVHQVARIKRVNKIIWFEKCDGFGGYFMRLMNLVNYIFVHQDAGYGLNFT